MPSLFHVHAQATHVLAMDSHAHFVVALGEINAHQAVRFVPALQGAVTAPMLVVLGSRVPALGYVAMVTKFA